MKTKNNNIIEAHELSKKIKVGFWGLKKTILKNVSFHVPKGSIIGFVGPNGAGKSTTIKVLLGAIKASSGTVTIMGQSPKSVKIKSQIGYLPELNPLYGEMRVYDLLHFTAQIRNISGNNFKDSLIRVIDQCGLKGVMHKNISACSKGYKQRTGLAMAMIHDPKILLLDEPVTGLDPNQIVEIRELIKNLGQEKIVMVSSHILQEIQAT